MTCSKITSKSEKNKMYSYKIAAYVQCVLAFFPIFVQSQHRFEDIG